MRDDQPVVSAASWMVSASTGPNLIKVVSRFGRLQDGLAALGALLVETDHRADGVVGALQPLDDVSGLHRVVALPRRVHVDLGPGVRGALGLHAGRLSGDVARLGGDGAAVVPSRRLRARLGLWALRPLRPLRVLRPRAEAPLRDAVGEL